MVCQTPHRRGTVTKSHASATTHTGVVNGMSASGESVIQKPPSARPYVYAREVKKYELSPLPPGSRGLQPSQLGGNLLVTHVEPLWDWADGQVAEKADYQKCGQEIHRHIV
jgi:hypothetical protein